MRYFSLDHYGSFNRWLQGTGSADDEAGLEATCIIFVKHPELGIISAYCKFYHPENGNSRGLINETAGYMLAEHFGLPQPKTAFLMDIPIKKLDYTGMNKKHDWIKKLSKKNIKCVAFCTADMGSDNAYVSYNKQEQMLREDLKAWPLIHKTAIFDELISNPDRNIRNLIRLGKANYALIDHGRLITPSGQWNGSDLQPDVMVDNRLLKFTYNTPLDLQEQYNKLMLAAEQQILPIADFGDLLIADRVAKHLCQGTDFTVTTLSNFFQTRALNADQRTADRYGLT